MTRQGWLALVALVATPTAASALPDLAPSSASLQVCDASDNCVDVLEAGKQAQLTVTVVNSGAAEATAFAVEAWISADGALDDADLLLQTWSDQTLVAAADDGTGNTIPAELTLSEAVTVPAALANGPHQLIVVVDPVDGTGADLVDEADETNNQLVNPAQDVLGVPELTAESVSMEWCHGGTGECSPWIFPFDKRWEEHPTTTHLVVTNAGAQEASAEFEVRLSPDGSVDGSGVEMVRGGVLTVPGATWNAVDQVWEPGRVEMDLPVVWPDVSDADAGQSFNPVLAVDVSDAYAEANEDDNDVVGTPRVQLKAAADLTAINIMAPVRYFTGRSGTVTFTLLNKGDFPADHFYYKLFLTKDRTINFLKDILIGESQPISIGANTSVLQVDVPVSIPENVTPGDYWVGLAIDPFPMEWIPETVDGNNTPLSLATVHVYNPAPDLVVRDLQVPATAAAGETVPVSLILKNDGVEPADFDYGVYLSFNEIISADDLLLMEASASLEAGGRGGYDHWVRIPADYAEGTAYIGVLPDAAQVVAELDETNNAGPGGQAIELHRAQLTVATEFVPEAILGGQFSWRFVAKGGSGDYAWQTNADELPPGLALDASTGILSGTPSAAGAYRFVVEVQSAGMTASRAYTVWVNRPTVSLSISTAVLPPAIVQTPYESHLAALGGTAPYTWQLKGKMPGGLELSEDGRLAGTPTLSGQFTPTFIVTDAKGRVAERQIPVQVSDGGMLTISTPWLPPAFVGEAFIAGFDAVGGSQPLVWALAGGELPKGIALDAEQGILQGTPQSVGRYSFQVRVRDAKGLYDTNTYTLEVSAQEVAIANTSLSTAEVGTAYEETLGVTFSTNGPYTWALASGRLPEGLTLDGEAGLISGTPAEGTAGLYPLVLKVTDARGATGRAAFALEVFDMSINKSQPLVEGCSSAGGGSLWPALALLGLVLVGRKRRRFLPLLAAVLLLPVAASAQTSGVNYKVFQQPKTYVPLSGGAPLTISGTGTAVVSIGFPFEFYGVPQNTITVSAEGIIQFGNHDTVASANKAIPDGNAPNGFIAPWWDDMIAVTGSTISTKVEGSDATGHTLVIQYDNWKRRFAADSYTLFDFQVRLVEGTNDIRISYGPVEAVRPADASDSATATVGIEGPDGLRGVSALMCNPECAELDFPSDSELYFSALPNLDVRDAAARPTGHGGMPLRVTGRVDNLGGRAAKDVELRAALSTDAHYDRGVDPLMAGGVTIASVPSDGSVSFAFDAVMPTTVEPGKTYYVFVDPNPNLPKHPFNRSPWSAAIDVAIGQPTPDWAAKMISSPSLVRLGQTADVSFEIRNAGNLDGDVLWRVVLSENDVISREDQVLQEGTAGLAAGEVRRLDIQPTIPANTPAGRYYFGVIADPENTLLEPSEMNNAGAALAPGTVGDTQVQVVRSTLPSGRVGEPYQVWLNATGGDGNYRWVSSAGLPAGLTLTEDGSLEGRPEVAGTQSVSVIVESRSLIDGTKKLASATLPLPVASVDAALTLVTAQLPEAVYASEYGINLVALGGAAPYQWTVTSGELPLGVSLGDGGTLGGVPQEFGTFDFTALVTDADGNSSEASLSLVVAAPGNLVMATNSVPEARIGEQYSVQFEAVGGTAPYTWQVHGYSVLPLGLSLDEQTGELSGIPREVGVFDVMIRVVDSVQRFDTNTFRLVVGYDHGVSISNVVLPTVTIGQNYSAQLIAVGGLDPYRWRLAGGSLPDGLVLNEDGTITGKTLLEEEKVYPFVAEVTDTAGRQAMTGLALKTAEPPPVLLDDGGKCSSAAGAGNFALILVSLAGAVRRRRNSNR